MQTSVPYSHILHPAYSHPIQRLWMSQLPRKSQLVYPIFVVEGENQKQPIKSMPDIYRYSVDLLIPYIKQLVEKGLKSVLIFGVIPDDLKDEQGTYAGGRGKECCVHKAIKSLKQNFPQILIITDVCLCAYTSHGHCGILTEEGILNNAKSIERLGEVALSYVQAGADVIAPSDMMDGRVLAINNAIKDYNIPIMSYSAKFCSALYGPFRDVCKSAPQKFDRSSYQLPCGSKELAMAAVKRDIDEGASFIMVKPISAYLDIVNEIKHQFPHTIISCYHVSGEYSMICIGAESGLFDKKKIVLEYMESFQRAGCSIIITYFVPELLDWLSD